MGKLFSQVKRAGAKITSRGDLCDECNVHLFLPLELACVYPTRSCSTKIEKLGKENRELRTEVAKLCQENNT